jgi:hypothetical protein
MHVCLQGNHPYFGSAALAAGAWVAEFVLAEFVLMITLII